MAAHSSIEQNGSLPDLVESTASDASGFDPESDPHAIGRMRPPNGRNTDCTAPLKKPGSLDAMAQQALLRGDLEPHQHAPSALDPREAAEVAPAGGGGRHTLLRRLVKTLACLVVLFAVGWLPAVHYFETASEEAVVNARLVTIRAPIDGEVVAETPWEVGTEVESGRALMHVVNRRADRSMLNDFHQRVGALEAERRAHADRLDHLRRLHAVLLAQTRAFQTGRVRQLEARLAELNSEIAAAESKNKEAAANLERVSKLVEEGIQAAATLDRANRDAVMAAAAERSLRQRLSAIEVELNAARQGVFVGDSYNDQPSSSQRATEAKLRISEAEAELRSAEARLAQLKEDEREEAVRYSVLAEADLVVPIRGRIWEVLTAPGEEIRRGQDLLRVLDCSAVVVTATVSKRVFNRLQLGNPAWFRLDQEDAPHEGMIIHLTGFAAQEERLAIQPATLARESHRVTVAVPDMKHDCPIGRSGRVVFGPVRESGGVTERVRTQLANLLGFL